MTKEPGQIAFEAYWAEHKDHMPWDSDDLNNPRWARVEAVIRASALEEAAKVAESKVAGLPTATRDVGAICQELAALDMGTDIASAIRALIPRPADGGEAG